MTGKIQFKMRSEPARLRVTPTTGSATPRSGTGSFDLEALAALEAALGTLDGALAAAPQQAPAPERAPELADLLDNLEASLPPAPAPAPAVATPPPQPGLRTARELLAAMGLSPDHRPAPITPALDWTQAPANPEPSAEPRIEATPSRAEARELKNGDLPSRPVAPVEPERPRRAPAPQLEPPDFQLTVPKPRGLRWLFRR